MAGLLKTCDLIKSKKIGFLGAGKMGSSLASGFVNLLSKNCNMTEEEIKDMIYFYEPSNKLQIDLEKKGYRNFVSSEADIFKNTKIVLNCVKPNIVKETITNSFHVSSSKTLMISIAAGITIEYMESIYKYNFLKRTCEKRNSTNDLEIEDLEEVVSPNTPKIARIMTSHLAAIKEACCVYSLNKKCKSEDEDIIKFLLEELGTLKKIPEDLMNTYTSFIGSGPAFVYHFIESLVDSALKNGVDIQTAREMAVKTVFGAARYVAECENYNPNNSKYIVSTPKGTTIHGLSKLYENNFIFSVDQAITAAANRSAEIEKQNAKDVEKMFKELKKQYKI